MSASRAVFADSVQTPDALAAFAGAHPVRLSGRDVGVERAAVAAQGEVWSPQLLPYEAWTRASGQGSASSVSATADELMPADEIGLLYTGARGMGVSDEWRERVLAEAVGASEVARASSSAVAVPQSALRRADGSAALGEGDLSGVFAVRECEGGYALVAADLRRAAESVGSKDGLVVVLPSYVDDIPVVRIAAEAFARRLVRGVRVRFLAVPDTVESIADGAFSAVAAEHIHLGARVMRPGAQPVDLSATLPRLEGRAYSADDGNPHLRACGGSLYAREGNRLLFAAPPYAATLALDEGVHAVAAAAFAQGCALPRVVRCPKTVERVESRALDDAVWLFAEDAPVRASLRERGVRTAGSRALYRDGCWYDFDNEGAVLVAGPPEPPSASRAFAASARLGALKKDGAAPAAALAATLAPPSPSASSASAPSPAPSDSPAPLNDCAPMPNPASASESADAPDGADFDAMPAQMALPREVDGVPLARIGARALPFAPAALSIPDTVRIVERDNACRGTERLMLSQGLQLIGAHSFRSRTLSGIVSIPASVRGIGEGCFEYAVCRFEATGSVVHVTADQLLSCFMPEAACGVPFDYSRYDGLLAAGKSLPDFLGALLHRLRDATPPPAPEVSAALVARLREYGRDAMARVAKEGDLAMVEALIAAGFIDDATFDAQIELLRAANRADCVLRLMQWRQSRRDANGKADAARRASRERFAL